MGGVPDSPPIHQRGIEATRKRQSLGQDMAEPEGIIHKDPSA